MKADGVQNTVLAMNELKDDLSLYGFEEGCKSYSDIEKKDPEFAKVLNNIYCDMESRRSHNRRYNEFLCSNPKVKAVYSCDKKYENIPLFLRKYAADNDLPIIMVGEY